MNGDNAVRYPQVAQRKEASVSKTEQSWFESRSGDFLENTKKLEDSYYVMV